VAVEVPGIVLSLERNEANGQMACCVALDEARPLAEMFVCVCVCVGKRRQELRCSLCWYEQGVGRTDICFCVVWAPFDRVSFPFDIILV
jgi:hypothetical protein